MGLFALVIGRFFWMRRGVVSLSAADVQRRYEAGEKLVIVDVRESGEWRSGHIPGAVSVPLSNLDSLAKNLDPKATIMLVCASGNRSVTAYHKLKSKGFANLVNVSGGMSAWRGATTRK